MACWYEASRVARRLPRKILTVARSRDCCLVPPPLWAQCSLHVRLSLIEKTTSDILVSWTWVTITWWASLLLCLECCGKRIQVSRAQRVYKVKCLSRSVQEAHICICITELTCWVTRNLLHLKNQKHLFLLKKSQGPNITRNNSHISWKEPQDKNSKCIFWRTRFRVSDLDICWTDFLLQTKKHESKCLKTVDICNLQGHR